MKRPQAAKRPIVRLYAGRPSALREVASAGAAVGRDEQLVFRIEPDDLVTHTEKELLDAFHTLLKVRRHALGKRPAVRELEIHKLRSQAGLKPREIVERLGLRGGDSLRYVKRVLRRLRDYEHEGARRGLTPRQRAIVDAADTRAPQRSARRHRSTRTASTRPPEGWTRNSE